MVCRDGSVKLLDFGVAKVVDAFDYDISRRCRASTRTWRRSRSTACRSIGASTSSPPASCCTRCSPGGGCSPRRRSSRRCSASTRCEVAPPSVDNPRCSRALDAVVLKALSRDPVDRFDSGDEMAAALMQVERVVGRPAARGRVPGQALPVDVRRRLRSVRQAGAARLRLRRVRQRHRARGAVDAERAAPGSRAILERRRARARDHRQRAGGAAHGRRALSRCRRSSIPGRPRPKLKRVRSPSPARSASSPASRLLRMYTPATSRRTPAATEPHGAASRRVAAHSHRAHGGASAFVRRRPSPAAQQQPQPHVEAAPVKLRDDVPTQPLPTMPQRAQGGARRPQEGAGRRRRRAQPTRPSRRRRTTATCARARSSILSVRTTDVAPRPRARAARRRRARRRAHDACGRHARARVRALEVGLGALRRRRVVGRARRVRSRLRRASVARRSSSTSGSACASSIVSTKRRSPFAASSTGAPARRARGSTSTTRSKT